jgi:hypothetical protein
MKLSDGMVKTPVTPGIDPGTLISALTVTLHQTPAVDYCINEIYTYEILTV